MHAYEKTVPRYVGKKTDTATSAQLNAYAQTAAPATSRSYGTARNYDRQRPGYSNPGRYNLQDQFLAALCEHGVECDLMLRNEASLRGRVIDYDNWSLLIDKEDKSYLIFKSGIMALVPLENVKYDPSAHSDSGREVAEQPAGYNYGYS